MYCRSIERYSLSHLPAPFTPLCQFADSELPVRIDQTVAAFSSVLKTSLTLEIEKFPKRELSKTTAKSLIVIRPHSGASVGSETLIALYSSTSSNAAHNVSV